MLYGTLEIVTLLAASLMVGNELTVGLFLHPTLSRQPDSVYAPTRRAFAELFGRVMPFWYTAVAVLTIATAWSGPPLRLVAGKTLLASAVLWVVTIVFTVILPAPLNSRFAKWNLQSLPPDWREQCERWDRLHAIRMVLLLAALVCLFLGTVGLQP